MNSSLPVRLATWIIAFVIGAFYGLAGTIGHSYAIVGIPVGLVVAVIGSAALLLAVRLLTADRWSTLATGGGMMVSTLVFSGEGPGGSVVVPQTEISLVWTFAVPLVVALAVAWPSLPSVDEAATRDA